ncbi:TauD/TfdA dioxygenase family protein [Streptomyces viridochromogenes]|uniref:Putative Taurine catabolism dioxygenase n=1 Tax=Streptomyces viridochromogenes Tue57 TaxID=1160705 RepID=L8PHV5_STRVR|nr:TauD/TfdA family dioxygenase [Streptomyces viridochromogenes]ELS55794.1 putative Taurine catabolism dioxygenase [Streptomyces viridochromogenes Tue57]
MSLSLHPLDESGFGAVIDCNLATNAESLAPQLVAALHQHRLLIVPRQHLNHADLLTVASCFGTVDTSVDRRYAVSGFPGLTVISNIVEDGEHIGIYDGDTEEEWHADNSFKPDLTSATMLYSVITPAQGGETRFADATRAYAGLPPKTRQRIEPMRAVHSIEQLGVLQSQASGGQSSIAAGSLASHPEVEHPLVLTHPATGARSLLLGSMVISGITTLAEKESRALLDELLEHTTSAPYVYSHRWNQGDLVVWDNLATLHTASPCDSSRHRRLLYRAAVR